MLETASGKMLSGGRCCRITTIRVLYERSLELGHERVSFSKERIPLLASPRGGVAASPRKWCEASLSTPPGWCSLSRRSEHHPVLSKSGCCAIFSLSLGHPSSRDARRGIRLTEMAPKLDSCALR